MKIGILLYKYCSLWAAFGSYELLQRANVAQGYFIGENSDLPKYDISFIAADNDKVQTSYPIPIPVDDSMADNKKYDLIVIPGFQSNPQEVIRSIDDIAIWLKRKHDEGSILASTCTAAFLIAKTGLLDGKTATTHWLSQDTFKSCFPNVRLDMKKVIIDYDSIMMSGSATSFQNLILHIIEKTMGRTIAVGVSKIYLIDVQRDSPETYMNLTLSKNHKDEEIKQSEMFIKKNFTRKLSIDELADNVSMTKRTFLRRFRNATNETPLNYIQKVKVEKAKELLENERKTFEEISFIVGYEDANAFRKIFVRETGIAPMKYRARYQIEV